jgi:hypothetical protein
MSQLYIRLMTGFYTHRKTLRLKARLGNDAYWVVPRIWSYCAENQPDGDLKDYTAQEIAMLVAYEGDANAMLEALKCCGFIDDDGRIHDWFDHNGYHKRYSDRAKTAASARWGKEKNQKKEVQKRKEDSGDKHCMSDASSNATSINTSKSRTTIDELKAYVVELGFPPSDGEGLFYKWQGNGWVNGKSPIKDWKATVRSWITYGYLASQKREQFGQKPKLRQMTDAEIVAEAMR